MCKSRFDHLMDVKAQRKMYKIEQQAQSENTFRPKTNQRLTVQGPVEERLLKSGLEKESKLKQQREVKSKNELKGVTFKPKTN